MATLSFYGTHSLLIVIFSVIIGALGNDLTTDDDLPSTESPSVEDQKVEFAQLEEIAQRRHQQQPSEIFNVYLVQKADGRRELCFPLNFTDSFASLADRYMLANNLAVQDKPTPVPTPSSLSPSPQVETDTTANNRRKRSITWIFRRFLMLKSKVINTLIYLL